MGGGDSALEVFDKFLIDFEAEEARSVKTMYTAATDYLHPLDFAKRKEAYDAFRKERLETDRVEHAAWVAARPARHAKLAVETALVTAKKAARAARKATKAAEEAARLTQELHRGAADITPIDVFLQAGLEFRIYARKMRAMTRQYQAALP